MSSIERIQNLLGDEAESLLTFTCGGVPKSRIRVPGPDQVDACFGASDRRPQVLVNLERMHAHGRLAGTGYLSIPWSTGRIER